MRHAEISAVILAGGRSSRMGGTDKGLIPFHGKPMIAHVIATLSARVGHIYINANRNLDRYREFGHPLISDATPTFEGPLAGFLAAMETVDSELVLLTPCDSPLISTQLIDRLIGAKQRSGAEIAVAHDGRRLQPVYALLSVSLADSLRAFLARGERKIDRWYPLHDMVEVDCSDLTEAFININTPEELRNLEQARRLA